MCMQLCFLQTDWNVILSLLRLINGLLIHRQIYIKSEYQSWMMRSELKIWQSSKNIQKDIKA